MFQENNQHILTTNTLNAPGTFHIHKLYANIGKKKIEYLKKDV
jgi:hypothetical protein